MLGKVPAGLTHNDVLATFGSVLADRVEVESVTKRRLKGGMISLVARFEDDNTFKAEADVRYAATSVYNFSFDLIGLKYDYKL